MNVKNNENTIIFPRLPAIRKIKTPPTLENPVDKVFPFLGDTTLSSMTSPPNNIVELAWFNSWINVKKYIVDSNAKNTVIKARINLKR